MDKVDPVMNRDLTAAYMSIIPGLGHLYKHQFRTGLLVAVLFFLHHFSDAAVAASFDPQSGFGRFLRRMTGLGERAIERLGLLFRTLVDVLRSVHHLEGSVARILVVEDDRELADLLAKEQGKRRAA